MKWHSVFGNGVLYDEPLCRHTTFAIGGPADVFATPTSEKELARLWNLARERQIPVTILGNASNVLVRDGGIRGLVLSLKGLQKILIRGTTMCAGAGVSLSKAALAAGEAALTGLEFASGIPGSLGGGAFMNAGAYDGQMSDVVRSVRVLGEDGEWFSLSTYELGYAYRHSALQKLKGVITGLMLELQKGDKQEIFAKMQDFQQRRQAKQPLQWPSAGSVFKRPPGYFAAALIEECGLKGLSFGQAQVSPKHAGFIVNNGGAKAGDVLSLIRQIQEIVWSKKQVRLETEILIMGEDVI